MTEVFMFKMEEEDRIGLSYPWDRGIQKKIKSIGGRRYEGKHWSIPIEQYPKLVSIFGGRLSSQDDIATWYESVKGRLRIVIEGNHCKLTSEPDAFVKDTIEGLCSYRPKHARYIIQAAREKAGNKNIWFDPLVNRFKHNSFPVGVLDSVLEKLEGHVTDIKVDDLRGPVNKIVLEAPQIDLRDYQLTGVEELMSKYCAILHMAPGLGKTRVGCEVIRRRSVKSLFLVHTVDLLDQAIEVLEEHLGTDIGKIGDQQRIYEDITVGTVQTFYSILNKGIDEMKEDDKHSLEVLREASLIMLDESHHGSANLFERVLMYSQAKYRYGLTGTLVREAGDEVLYRCQIGNPVCNYTLKWGVDNGWLAYPVFIFYKYPHLEFSSRTFDEAYREGIVENHLRNEAIKRLAVGGVDKGDTVLVLVDQVHHGEILEEMISSEDSRVVFVQGADRSDFRKAVKGFMASGELKIVIATRIFDEGVDMPVISRWVNAVGGKSHSRHIQRVGRAMRLSVGKKRALICDFMDQGKYLESHSLTRIHIDEAEGFEPSIMNWEP